MFREALHILVLRDKPSIDGAERGDMLPGEIGRQIEETADGMWAKVVIFSNFLQVREGWIRLKADIGDLTRIVEAPPRLDFSVWAFLKGCVDGAGWVNAFDPQARFFVVPDYLIALANIESGLKNAKSKNPSTDGVGPFQLSSQQWARFLANKAGAEFRDVDREDPMSQISGAACLALDSMNAISEGIAEQDAALGDNETSGETGPYIPSYVDVLLAHMFGNEAAIALRRAKMTGDDGKSVDSVLAAHVPPDQMAALLDFRAGLLRDHDTKEVETVDGMLINADRLLNDEFRKAFNLMTELIPEDMPKLDGAAPWLAAAEAEEKLWTETLVKEDTPGGRERVLQYFERISFNTSTVQPWCGAFVGHCMIESRAPFDKLVVSGPARAANWKSWGNATIPLGSDDVPRGAVVVLAPEKGSARSGHVGFFSRYFGTDRDQVELLGGNQSNTVTRTKFARSKIAAIRWHSPLEAKENEDMSTAIGASSPGQFGPLLDFIAQFESNRNYNAFFGSTTNTKNPEFTAMTVDAVLDWQRNFVRRGSPSSAVGKYQFIRDTLLGLVVAGHAKRGDLFDQKVQDKLAVALLKGRRLGKFLAGSISAVDFGVELAKEWASLPVPRDVARKNRLIRMGQSYYAGDGLNKALVAVPPFLAAINSIRA